MEIDDDPRRSLLEAERAEALPYLDYPPTPAWFFPAAGSWGGLLVLALAGMDDDKIVALPLLVALLVAEAAFFTWYRRYRRTSPSLTGAPPEIRRQFAWYLLGVVVVLAACGLALVHAGAIAAAAVAFVGVAGGLWWYERRYAKAAEAARRRLR